MRAALPLFPARSGPGDFLRGFALPFRAAKLIWRTPRLRWLSFFAGLVTLVSLVAVVLFVGRITDDFVSWAFFPKPESWYGLAGYWVLSALTFLLGVVVGAQTVPLIVLAPLQDPLSESAEALYGGRAPPPFSLARFVKGAWVALTHNLSRVVLLLGGHACLLPLNFLPGIGSMAWTVLATAWTVFWLAAEYLDGAMARHFYGFREVLAAVRRRLLLSAGFGLAVYLLLWVPVINFFFMPVAVVGGTLLFCGLRAAGAVQDLGNAPRG